MAEPDNSKIIGGAAKLSVGPYVTAGGAATLVDWGELAEPPKLQGSRKYADIQGERQIGTIKKFLTDYDCMILFKLLENQPEFFRAWASQPAANKTGTAPNETVLVGTPVIEYFQVQLVVPGYGTTGIDTYTGWKGVFMNPGEIPFAKGAPQDISGAFQLLPDTSVTTADKNYKRAQA